MNGRLGEAAGVLGASGGPRSGARLLPLEANGQTLRLSAGQRGGQRDVLLHSSAHAVAPEGQEHGSTLLPAQIPTGLPLLSVSELQNEILGKCDSTVSCCRANSCNSQELPGISLCTPAYFPSWERGSTNLLENLAARITSVL